MSKALLLLLALGCANVTSTGKEVRYVESDGSLLEFEEIAETLKVKHNCREIGVAHAKASHFPPSYSLHENEVHAALKNRAAKMGGNLVIANFYVKPARGVVMECPEEYLVQNEQEVL